MAHGGGQVSPPPHIIIIGTHVQIPAAERKSGNPEVTK